MSGQQPPDAADGQENATQNDPQGPPPAFSIPRQSGAGRGCLIILLVVVAVLALGAGCFAWAMRQLPDTPIPAVSDSGVEHTVEYRVTTSEPAQVKYSAGARTASVCTRGDTTLTLSVTGREVVNVSVTVSSQQPAVVGCEILVDGVSVDSVTDTGLADCTGLSE